MTSVAIIIPTYNDKERLRLCLEAIAGQSFSISNITVYVVDNNSSEDVKAVVDDFSFCDYLHETSPGAYNARNKALVALKDEEFIGFTDADCLPQVDWVENAVNMLQQFEDLAIGGRVSVFPEHNEANLYELYEVFFAFPQQAYIKSDNFAVTANLFTSRQVLNKVGHFNTSLYSGGDAEWGNRLVSKGLRLVYADNVTVKHPARNSLAKLTSKVKRTVGGCYKQRDVNPIMAQSFSLLSLCRGYIPPVKAIHILFKQQIKLGLWKNTQMILLLTWLKYHKNTIKIFYKIGILKEYQRF
ncbi:glycosyltransferase family 2 protein [Alteromonadaceae bacterium BrNp21-10]|nr:glycosyltransferase family 2 protein [Alteromonadaceae bacterium BrNp21-10]